MPDPVEVRKVPIKNVSDASGLADLVDDGAIDADRVVAIVGKTEGNGGVNDYTRIIADRAFREVLTGKGSRSVDQVRQVPIVWSGGTDGVISPHATIFATVAPDRAEQTDEPRLTVGFAMSEPIRPEEIGRRGMIEKVSAAVRVAMDQAGITDPADVHYVQTKTPLLTIHTIRDAKARGQTVWTEHPHESMDLSNGCTGLGVAVALGEIEMPTDAQVMNDRGLYSAVASCSSGVELDQAQVVVVGNIRGVGGRYRIGHSVMRDALDADGIWAAIQDAGLDIPTRPHWTDLDGRLVNAFLKCEVSQDGTVRGRRNAMLDDSDVHWHRQIKGCVGGVAASVTGDPAVFVSVSAAHQGPDGGGPVAAIVDLGPEPPTGYAWTGEYRRASGIRSAGGLGSPAVTSQPSCPPWSARSADTGAADPRVVAALAAYASGTGDSVAVVAALAVSRVLVPVVAVLDEAGESADGSRTDKASHMATVTTMGRDGRRGLLAFTCTESMSRWQATARPVPVSTRDAAEAALADGAEAVVVDLAGPVVFSIEAPDLRALAAGWRALGADPGRPIGPDGPGWRSGIGRLIRRVRR